MFFNYLYLFISIFHRLIDTYVYFVNCFFYQTFIDYIIGFIRLSFTRIFHYNSCVSNVSRCTCNNMYVFEYLFTIYCYHYVDNDGWSSVKTGPWPSGDDGRYNTLCIQVYTREVPQRVHFMRLFLLFFFHFPVKPSPHVAHQTRFSRSAWNCRSSHGSSVYFFFLCVFTFFLFISFFSFIHSSSTVPPIVSAIGITIAANNIVATGFFIFPWIS